MALDIVIEWQCDGREPSGEPCIASETRTQDTLLTPPIGWSLVHAYFKNVVSVFCPRCTRKNRDNEQQRKENTT